VPEVKQKQKQQELTINSKSESSLRYVSIGAHMEIKFKRMS